MGQLSIGVTITSFLHDGIRYRQRWVRCNSERCKTCRVDRVACHGPYWYAYVLGQPRAERKVTYIGKDLPSELETVRIGGTS